MFNIFFKTSLLFYFSFLFLLGLSSVSCKASDFGTTGLITLPTARMMSDGFLTATIARNQVVDIYNITYQVTPSVETTFRYATNNPRRSVTESRDPTRADRSYSFKALLNQESNYLPAIAFGIRDVLGTGLWSGEYITATKAFGNLDLSFGLGWGRYAGRGGFDNPLSVFSNRFNERPDTAGVVGGGVGGEVRGESFFRGEAALFSGLRYQFSKLPAALLVEYSGDDYSRERSVGTLKRSKPFNYGLTWKLSNEVSVSVTKQQDQFTGLTLRAALDTKRMPERRYQKFFSAIDPGGKAEAPDFLDLDAWYDRMLFDIERSGLRMHKVYSAPGRDSVAFVVSNDRYGLWADALQQFFLIAELHLPDSLRSISVDMREDNLNGQRVEYIRLPRGDSGSSRVSPISRFTYNGISRAESIKIVPSRFELRPSHKTNFGFPQLALGADLAMRVQLMDPNEPLKHQFYVKGTARLALTDQLNIWSSYTIDLANDFNKKRPSNSVLPRVRSEINRYLADGKNGVDTFFAEYKRSLLPDIHTRAFIGLVEEMFGGVGSEFLYQPFDSRWALGGNLNWVKQRSYNKNFSFRSYNVVTGHLSAFYASPWNNLDFALHMGRYLAGDRGLTVEARRTFDNGFSIGAFFTRTNVSAKDFGEGSFDKGLFLRMPFHLFLPGNTRGTYSTVIRSIERDGGRRLGGGVGRMWWDRRSVRLDSLLNNTARMVP